MENVTKGRYPFRTFIKDSPVKAFQMDRPFIVDTLEKKGLEGKAGDWLCEGVRGERWPIDRDIFLETYKELPSYRSLSQYHLSGTGKCFAVVSDRNWRSSRDIGKALIGNRVLIDDEIFTVKGIEVFSKGGVYSKGMSFGILVHDR